MAFMELSLFLSFLSFLAIFCAVEVGASETHTIKFINQCGHGTPCLVLNGQNVSTGQDYTVNDIFAGIAYLQTGQCNTNGEGCTLLEMNLINPACAGCGSSVDISLISPHVYNVEASFAYYNGCDGYGADCNGPNCATAFFAPEDWDVQRECQANNVNLLIAFCANASDIVLGGGGSSPASSSSTSSSSTHTSIPLPSTGTTLSNTTMSTATILPLNVGSTPSASSSGSSPSASAKKCLTRPSSTSTLARREPTALGAKIHRRHRALRGSVID
ncbi:hypothetical protein AZE42_05471 [Rhizopogon vesiculosus]|uniref:Glycopeptide n=1 Tax=Rhizopogon vesiculosus TaxID=180088 RepID=A0A1J8PRW8_9AGAM|nr:hypothetical protein AZE42_05471 [Rhizopogon vesiculosus]